MSEKKLTRTVEGKLIGGVCSGLGKYTNINPWIFRLLFILFGFTTVGVIVYVIACLALPQE
ncbi:MAG: PspC domain-containing protein [Bacteroidaceae bacterium]|nr:PspC domain-containing protein [Bacteroidaceae bacterium]